MKFDLYVAGATRDEGQLSQMGGAGIVLIVSDDLGRSKYRHCYFGLGGSSLSLAEIQAARLALASIAPAYRGYKTTLYTDSVVVATIVTDSAESSSGQPAAAELKRWWSYYKDIEVVVVADPDEHLHKAQELARDGLAKQEHFDSGTISLTEASHG